MATLSVCMIIKNEANILEKCLASIAPVADEIIIADTGSTDNSKEIARKYTDKIYDFEWVNDFAQAVNFVVDKASSEYICKWDGDWVLTKESLPRLKTLKNEDFRDSDIVCFKWNNNPLPDGTFKTHSMQHFIHKKGKFRWHSPIHVYPRPLVEEYRKLAITDIEVNHYKDPNYKSYRYKQTLTILQNVIDTTDHENRIRLRPYLAESLAHAGEYEQSIELYKDILEHDNPHPSERAYYLSRIGFGSIKLAQITEGIEYLETYCDSLSQEPQFLLALADLTTIIDPIQGYYLYQEYLELNYTGPKGLEAFDSVRFVDHPKRMIASLQPTITQL